MLNKKCRAAISLISSILVFLPILLFASPPYSEEFKKASIKSCKSYLKQNFFIILDAVQDDDKERFPANLTSFEQYFQRYKHKWTKFGDPEPHDTRRCFLDRRTKIKASYSLNKHLVGLPIASIKNPDKVVMLYEGSNGRLDYRLAHADGAHVLFVDGSIRLIDLKSTSTLKWKP